MKRLVMTVLSSLTAAACATSPGSMVEAGYPTGSLAVAAIERGDWDTAERLLTEDRSIARDNPARLINLGRVYMATGRSDAAVRSWEQALASPVHVDVETADGRMRRTDEVAREAISRFQPVRSASVGTQ